MTRRIFVCIVVAVLFCSNGLLGQNKNKKKLKWNLESRIYFKHNDNVFRLLDRKIARLELGNNSDLVSGRFKDMNSVTDYILSPKVIFNLKFPSPFGRKISVITSFGYNIYFSNSKSNYSDLGLEIRQQVGKNGRVNIEFDGSFGFFMRNYLSDAIDANNNGNITSSERRYAAGIYNEYELEGSYRYSIRVRDKKNKNFFQTPGIFVEPLASLLWRNFNQTFSNRSRNGVEIGIELTLDPNQYFNLEFNYSYIMLKSPNEEELVLIDETATGLNMGDSAVTTNIDRSRNQHNIGGSLVVFPLKKLKIYLEYELQELNYLSTNPLDYNHYNWAINRTKLGFGVRWRLKKKWYAKLEYNQKYFGAFTRGTVQGYLGHRF